MLFPLYFNIPTLINILFCMIISHADDKIEVHLCILICTQCFFPFYFFLHLDDIEDSVNKILKSSGQNKLCQTNDVHVTYIWLHLISQWSMSYIYIYIWRSLSFFCVISNWNCLMHLPCHTKVMEETNKLRFALCCWQLDSKCWSVELIGFI